MIERNRQFGRVARPAESSALMAGRNHRKRVGAGRAKQAALGFAKPRPTAQDPAPEAALAPGAMPIRDIHADALLEAVAVALAEPAPSDGPGEKAPRVETAPDVAGQAQPADALDVAPPSPADRPEPPRKLAPRPARKRTALRLAGAACVALACLFGLGRFSDARLFATPAVVAVTASAPTIPAVSAPAPGEARPSPVQVSAALLVPVETDPVPPAIASLPGAGPAAIVETAVIAPSPDESVTAWTAALSDRTDPSQAAPTKLAAPRKPVAKPVAAKPAAQQVSHAEPKAEPKAARSRGLVADFFADLLP